MKKYDIIIPIGSSCKASQNLRNLGLQKESLPFDWILTRDINQIKNMLSTRFANFLEYSNMEYKCQESAQTDIYMDTKTQIGFWHDFPHEISIEKSFSQIKSKYNRRIERLYQLLSKSENILFFRINTIRPQKGLSVREMIYLTQAESDDKIIQWVKEMRKLFPTKKISLLEVSLYNEPHTYSKREIFSGVTRVEIFSDLNYEWEGNPAIFKKLFTDITLTNRAILRCKITQLKYYMRRFWVDLGSKLGVKLCQEHKMWLKNRFNR